MKEWVEEEERNEADVETYGGKINKAVSLVLLEIGSLQIKSFSLLMSQH